MYRKNTETYQMLTHVVDFGTRNVGIFPKVTGAKKLLETLATGVESLSEQAGIWMASRTALRNGRTAKDASRESLKNYLKRPRNSRGHCTAINSSCRPAPRIRI